MSTVSAQSQQRSGAPISADDIFPRMSNRTLLRVALRAFLIFTVAAPVVLVAYVVLANRTGIEMSAVPSILLGLVAVAVIAAIVGLIPTAIAFLVAVPVQRVLNRVSRPGMHLLAAGVLAGGMASLITGVVAALMGSDGAWVEARLLLALALGVIAAGSSIAAWLITRHRIARDAARYGVRPIHQGAPA